MENESAALNSVYKTSRSSKKLSYLRSYTVTRSPSEKHNHYSNGLLRSTSDVSNQQSVKEDGNTVEREDGVESDKETDSVLRSGNDLHQDEGA